MAATTAGAIKALVEGAGLGLAVYRDAAPKGTVMPYVTVEEGTGFVADRDGLHDDGVDHTVQEFATVHLWQRWRDDRGRPADDYALPDRLARSLRATRLPAAPTLVHGLRLAGRVRLLEVEANVVHHAYTVSIRRVL